MVFLGQPFHAVRLGDDSAFVVEICVVALDGHARFSAVQEETSQNVPLGPFCIDLNEVGLDAPCSKESPNIQAAHLVFHVRMQVMFEK